MSLEAIKKVSETELDVENRKAEAAAAAKRQVSDAERSGRELLEKSRADADAQAKHFMAEAEAQAAKQTEKILAEAERASGALRQSAQLHLDDAAALVVRRVVNI